MCSDHNGLLDQRFEHTAKPVIRQLLDAKGSIVLNAADAEVAGVWYLKTWLLLAHPQVVWTQPGWSAPPWEPVPVDLYSWMVNGQPPPGGLSVWAFKQSTDEVPDDETRRIFLPAIVVDGTRTKFQAFRFALDGVEVHLVFHPGWEMDHPLERDDSAIKLWPPSPGEPADFAALRVVKRDEFRWADGPTFVFWPGKSPSELPPLSETNSGLFLVARNPIAARYIQAAL